MGTQRNHLNEMVDCILCSKNNSLSGAMDNLEILTLTISS